MNRLRLLQGAREKETAADIEMAARAEMTARVAAATGESAAPPAAEDTSLSA